MEIKFKNVSFVYNPKTPFAKLALDQINVEFKKGQINGIVGKSGSGKTTLIEMIDALIIPTKGHVKVDHFTVAKDKKIKRINDLRFQVGLVFATPEEQFFNATVYDEISFGMRYFNYKLDHIKEHVSDALKMVGLTDKYLTRDPFTLSNGEMRKVAIASVLVFNPKVIIFDEPTIGLDDKSKNNLIKIIRTLKTRYQKTIIIVTHDVDMLHKIVEYVYVMYEGKIVMEGTKYEVFKEELELKKYGVAVPKIMAFANYVLANKQIKLGYRDDINDLIKDVYRHVK